MLVLVVNAGSSSLKYQLLNMDDESVLAKGNCDRIGIDGHISHKTADGRKVDEDCSFPTHTEAFEKLVEVLTSGEGKVIDSMSEIKAVGRAGSRSQPPPRTCSESLQEGNPRRLSSGSCIRYSIPPDNARKGLYVRSPLRVL